MGNLLSLVMVVLAQPVLDYAAQANQVNALWALFGLPGAVAGVAIAVLTGWRYFAPRVWDSWPRWARYGLGFSAPACAAVAMGVIRGQPVATAVIAGVMTGLGSIGLVETGKTLAKPRAGRSLSLRVPIVGPGGASAGSIVRYPKGCEPKNAR